MATKAKSKSTASDEAKDPIAEETERLEPTKPSTSRVAAVSHGDGTYTFGIARGAERYDSGSGQLLSETRVSKKDIESALAAADDKHKNRLVDDGLRPKIDPSDHRADSSPRSEDRPPILISSETNPSPANPEPSDEAQGADLPRDEFGIAQIPANEVTSAQPNLVLPPEDVEKGKETGGPTPTELKAQRDAKAADGNPPPLSAREVGVAAARAVRDGSADAAAKAKRQRPSRAKAKAKAASSS